MSGNFNSCLYLLLSGCSWLSQLEVNSLTLICPCQGWKPVTSCRCVYNSSKFVHHTLTKVSKATRGISETMKAYIQARQGPDWLFSHAQIFSFLTFVLTAHLATIQAGAPFLPVDESAW